MTIKTAKGGKKKLVTNAWEGGIKGQVIRFWGRS